MFDKSKSRNADGTFGAGNSAGAATRWQPGQSGNPGGKTQRRIQFEEALADALAGDNPEERAQELADICWAGARKGEAWSVQLLFARLSPQPVNVKMEVERVRDEIDFSKFTDAEMEAFGRILDRIDRESKLLEQ
jgi:hypothetical protein